MGLLIVGLRLCAAPVFLGLGLLFLTHPSLDHGAMAPQMAVLCGLNEQAIDLFGFRLDGVTLNTLSSMGLMYLLMGLFHLGPWLNLFDRKPND